MSNSPGKQYLTRTAIFGIFALGVLLLALGCVSIISFTAVFDHVITPLLPLFSTTGSIRNPHTYELVSAKVFGLRYVITMLGAVLCSFAYLWKSLLQGSEFLSDDALNEQTGVRTDTRGNRAAYTGALLCIVLLGAFLRAIKLNQSFCHDEISMIEIFLKPFGFWRYFPAGLGDHRLCSIISYPLLKIFGAHETILRLPFFLIGVATIPLSYRFAKRFFSVQVALGASLLIALASYHIYYSNQARGYVGMVFFLLASSFLLLKILSPASRHELTPKKYYFLLAALTALGIYNHFFYLVPMGMQFLFLIAIILLRLVSKRPVVRATAISISAILLALISGFLLSLVLYGPMVLKAIANQISVHMNTPPPLSFYKYFGEIVTGSPGHEYALVYCVLFLVGVAHLSKNRQTLIGSYLFIIVLVPLIGSKIFSMHFETRYFIFILPFLLLGAVHGCMVIANVFKRKMGPVILFVLLTALSLMQIPGLINYLGTPSSLGYKSCAHTIERLAGDKDSIYAIGIEPGTLFTRFYMRAHTVKVHPTEKEFFDRVNANEGSVWVIVPLPQFITESSPEENRIFDFVKNNFMLVSDFENNFENNFGQGILLYRESNK